MIELVERYTVLAVVVGSRAYGLDGPGSDCDRRGVYVAPTRLFWRLDKPATHVDGPAAEQFSWEVERFCALALQANPTVLEVLWSPLVEAVTADGRQLLAARRAFLSRRVAQTYGGYARDQLDRVAVRRQRTGQTNHKQAMHMIRLLFAGAHLLRTGEGLGSYATGSSRCAAGTCDRGGHLGADQCCILTFPDVVPLRLHGPSAWCHAVLFAYLRYGPAWQRAPFLYPVRRAAWQLTNAPR